jgi:drug/metabolite transporter (DMT)-like permease
MNLSPKQWVVLTALISGFAVYYNSIAVRGVDAVGFAMAKNLLAAVALLGIAAIGAQWKQFKAFSSQQWLQLLAIAIIGGSIPFALFFGGLSIVANGAGASFIYRLLFIFSAGAAIVFLRERPDWKVGAGVLLILAANLLLLPNLNFGLGEVMVLAATLMWSAENILLKKALNWITPDALAAARLGLGGMILLMTMAALAPASAISIVSLPLVPLILSALLILGFTMTYYRGLAGTSVSEATAILTLGGLVSALLPALLNSKLPGVMEGLSLALIGLGVAIILASAGKHAASDGLSPCKA